MHERLSTLLGAEWSLKVARRLVTRYGSLHIAELHSVLLLKSFLLALSLFQQRIRHDRRVVHGAPAYQVKIRKSENGARSVMKLIDFAYLSTNYDFSNKVSLCLGCIDSGFAAFYPCIVGNSVAYVPCRIYDWSTGTVWPLSLCRRRLSQCLPLDLFRNSYLLFEF